MTRKISGLLFVVPLTALRLMGDTNDALAAYKDANYKVAIPLLKTAVAADGKNEILHAALLSALSHEGLVDDASDEADADETAFPQSADVMAARGEFAYEMADMAAAQKLFRAALKIKENTPHAALGLARVLRAASFLYSSRLLLLRAHEIDPDDALITKFWLSCVPKEKLEELLNPFARAHPWLYRNFETNVETGKQLNTALGKRKAFELDGAPSEVNLRILDILDGPRRFRGVGLEMKVNGERKLTLMLDTGATGVLLSQTLIDKLGLTHVGSLEARGIGDDGTRKAFLSVADTCDVGPVRFKTCVFRALQAKRVLGTDTDGLIGADVFDDYLIRIDFLRHSVNLKPFPVREERQQGYDREVPADEKDFTPVFRLGHHLYVSTQMNKQDQGLFMLDTGSSLSLVDATFASLSVKLHRDDSMHMRGISGEVKKVFEVEKAELQFAGFRQNNLGMSVIDLNNGPDPPEFRNSGILGLPVLMLFRLTIDYRNGLVHFERNELR